MTMSSVTLATRQPAAQPCPCGCASCEGTCCSLDCIEQPRFFCGQLLTDQDLTALVGWAQSKLRLARYSGGWGVVCGLELRAAPNGSGVIVGPGYAVSDCGDDIIVCADSDPLDLSRVGSPEDDACADPRNWRKETGDERPSVVIGGYSTPADELYIVDLYLSYAEEQFQAITALGRSVCGQAAACENSRVREIYRLTKRATTADTLPSEDRAQSWAEDYQALTAKLEQLASWDGLDQGLTDTPLRQFSFVQRWLADSTPGSRTDAQLIWALFWLLQDRRNAFLARQCHAVTEASRVPVGRVWLRRITERGKTFSRVVAIDGGAPYRRMFAPETLPAAPGQINLGRFIWQQQRIAAAEWADLGLQVTTEELNIPKTLAELKTALQDQEIMAAPDSQLTALVLTDPVLGERIVGFKKRTTTRPTGSRRTG